MAIVHGAAKRKAHCPIFGCGATVEIATSIETTVCDACGCPWWPLEYGFTGNDAESVKAFAGAHNLDGSPR